MRDVILYIHFHGTSFSLRCPENVARAMVQLWIAIKKGEEKRSNLVVDEAGRYAYDLSQACAIDYIPLEVQEQAKNETLIATNLREVK